MFTFSKRNPEEEELKFTIVTENVSGKHDLDEFIENEVLAEEEKKANDYELEEDENDPLAATLANFRNTAGDRRKNNLAYRQSASRSSANLKKDAEQAIRSMTEAVKSDKLLLEEQKVPPLTQQKSYISSEELDELSEIEDQHDTFIVYKKLESGYTHEFKFVIDYLKDIQLWRF